jgi:hypothetical protein
MYEMKQIYGIKEDAGYCYAIMLPLRNLEKEQVDRAKQRDQGDAHPNYAAMTPAELDCAGIDILVTYHNGGGIYYFDLPHAQQALELGIALQAAAAGEGCGGQAHQAAASCLLFARGWVGWHASA